MLSTKPRFSKAALDKISEKRAFYTYSEHLDKLIDGLFDDDEDDSEVPDSLVFKNIYGPQHIEKLLINFSQFFMDREVIKSYKIERLTSTLDLLDFSLSVVIGDIKCDFHIHLKF